MTLVGLGSSVDIVGQLFVNGLTRGAAYALVALGFALAYQSMRFFDLAYGALYTLAAYLAYSLTIQLGWPRYLGFPAAALLTAAAAFVIDAAFYRPMRRRSVTSLGLLVASLGLYTVLQNVISMAWGDSVQTIQRGHVLVGHALFGVRVTDAQLAILIISTIVLGAAWALLKFTRSGTILRALGGDPELVRLTGVDDRLYGAGGYAAGVLLAAIAAITTSLDTDLTPTMGFNVLVKGIVAFIVGGTRSLPGAALGGILLGVIENLAVWQLPSKWMDAIAFSLLAVFLILRPQGLLGSAR